MKKKILLGLMMVSALVVLGARLQAARAGQKYFQPVSLGNSWLGCTARGSFGSTRNSANNVEYITMRASYSLGSASLPTIFISARDSAGDVCTCQSTDAKMVTMASALTADSHIYFAAVGADCGYVEVNGGSPYEPKL